MARKGLQEQLWCEQLATTPALTIAQVETQIHQCATPPTLVGSSLGGFYATYLAEKYSLKAVLINPFVLHAGFDSSLFLGEHEMIYTGERFHFTAEHVRQIEALNTPTLTRPENFWLLAETGDEVLDYRHALQRYAACPQRILPDGNHSFSRWDDYLDEVLIFAGYDF